VPGLGCRLTHELHSLPGPPDPPRCGTRGGACKAGLGVRCEPDWARRGSCAENGERMGKLGGDDEEGVLVVSRWADGVAENRVLAALGGAACRCVGRVASTTVPDTVVDRLWPTVLVV